jgi:hypothetical protein
MTIRIQSGEKSDSPPLDRRYAAAMLSALPVPKPLLGLVDGFWSTVRVPEDGPLAFTILEGPSGQVMLQTRASLAEDLPAVAARNPTHLLYGDVASLSAAANAFETASVLVPTRRTFYGAKEIWLELPGGMILGLAEHAG